MKKQLVFFWDYYGPYHFARLGGAVTAASDTQFEVAGLELAGKSATYAWRRDAPTLRVDFHTLFPEETAEKISALRVYKAVSHYLSQRDVACLYVPSYWPAYALAATLAARRRGVKVVLMAESHYASGRNDGALVLVKRAFMRLYSSALVGGSAQRSFFRYLGLPDSHVFDGYDAVDNEYFSQRGDRVREAESEWREKLRLPPRYILSLGRFVPKKNLHMIIKAYGIARAQGRLKGIHLLFVGSGIERDSLIELSRSLNFPVVIRKNSKPPECFEIKADYAVHFHPFTQIEESPGYFALAECFVLASKVEEWGLVVNEAMASGCPVAVSRLVGCSYDLVESAQTGFRFDPDNPEELAWYLGALCSDSALRTALILRAKEKVREWGPRRFGENAIKAAFAANMPMEGAVENEDKPRPIILLQVSFPDYRIPVYGGLSAKLGPRFQLHTGMEYFTPDVKTCSEFRPWIFMVKNTFLFKRRLLWQGSVLSDILEAEIAIIELNPRILSNWLILFTRKIWSRPTLLWGHAWGRGGAASVRNLLRLLMMQLADGVVTYTQSQRIQLTRIFPDYRFYTAPNSLVTKEECAADVGESLEYILYVGRMNSAKKPGLLLDSFKVACKRLPENIRLCYVGDGKELGPLKASAHEKGIADRVLFKGHISDRGLLRWLYARSFCSVSPGYVGLSAIQSFSFGVPMIIANEEDHAPEIEACRDGNNCRFFKSGDINDLADRIVEMWEQREEWLTRRAALSAWVAENYSTDAMVNAFYTAISEIKKDL